MPTRTTEPGPTERGSARERLLTAASELFYEEGVHTVGIDRVIERAGVAKASLYNVFGSKDELVKAYLAGRHAITRDRITAGLARYGTARERLIGVFEIQGKTFAKPGFRGCAFIGASSESPRPGGPVETAADEYRSWIRTLFLDLAREAGAPDPEVLAKQLCLVYDGTVISAWMDRDPTAAATSVAVVTALVSAAIDLQP
ncbi:MAG: TetR/AcrR family transcriptional regulator [Jatrophihabitantaceae bacterium]